MCVGAATIKAIVCVLIYSGSGLVGNLCISIGGERRGGVRDNNWQTVGRRWQRGARVFVYESKVLLTEVDPWEPALHFPRFHYSFPK